MSQGLKRSLRVFGAMLLTLSAVTPASSVFVIVPEVINQTGTGAFLAMLAGAVLSVPTAYAYAELASAFPIAGGEYSMVGRIMSGDAAMVILWLNAFTSLLAAAALALGAASFLSVIWPGLNATIVALGMIFLTTVMGVLHIRTNAWITGVFLFLELAALVAIVGLGFWDVHQPLSDLTLHPIRLSDGGLNTTPLTLLGLATTISIFAYNGYGSAAYFAEEMHDPRITVARTIMWSLVVTVITELVPVTAALMGAPDLKEFLASENPFGQFILVTGGRTFAAIVSICIALAIFNAVLATVLQNARVAFSTGRDGTWPHPINRPLAAVHARYQSPWIATLVAGFTSMALCFLGLDLILVLSGTGIVIVYAAICLAAILGRRNGASAGAHYRMPLYPFWPVVGLIALAYVLVISALDPQLGQPSLIANGVLVILALAYYRLVVRRKGAWILTGPEDSLP
jgi:amino acid transporter